MQKGVQRKEGKEKRVQAYLPRSVARGHGGAFVARLRSKF